MNGSSDSSSGRANTSKNVDGKRFFIAACRIATMLVEMLFDGWL
jgi:hypothetical protein